jgi:hypothetical protein
MQVKRIFSTFGVTSVLAGPGSLLVTDRPAGLVFLGFPRLRGPPASGTSSQEASLTLVGS